MTAAEVEEGETEEGRSRCVGTEWGSRSIYCFLYFRASGDLGSWLLGSEQTGENRRAEDRTQPYFSGAFVGMRGEMGCQAEEL